MNPTVETINIDDIIVGTRARKDMGNVDGMVSSIKEFGLIQPIILNEVRENDLTHTTLVVGGRRLAALRRLGITELIHGTHFLWRYEEDNLRLKSIELEENLKRKDMTWDEVIAAKAKLLEIMQQIHGVQAAQGGRPTARESAAGTTDGFGVRKLAAMLGESAATTSSDLQLASMLKVMPHLTRCENKSAALRQGVLTAVVGVIQHREEEKKVELATAVANGTATEKAISEAKDWKLYEGDFRDNISKIASGSVDLVFTDLPYGVDLDKNNMQGINFTDSRAAIISLLPTITQESYRILREGRYAVYWFGFNFYTELKTSLEQVGFQVNPIPVVWIKHRNYSPNPLRWYTSGYEQAFVVCKGDAKLIRPGSNDLIDIPNISVNEKINVSQKPVQLCEKFILDMTLPSATIVDMFAGSGSTGVAAIKNGRKAVLFEKDGTQCLLIRNRLSGTTLPSNSGVNKSTT